MVKRLAIAVAGVAVMLGWWTLTGRGSGGSGSSGIPAKVWEGGGTVVTVELDTTVEARFSIWFSEHPEGEVEKRSLETSATVQPGHKEWSIDVPPGVGGHVEISASGNVPPGAKFSWKIRNSGGVIAENAEQLSAPLQQGYAFGMDNVVQDFTTGKLAEK